MRILKADCAAMLSMLVLVIVVEFTTPLVVRPGEFIAPTVRFRIGTATASQEVTYLVAFDGYWE